MQSTEHRIRKLFNKGCTDFRLLEDGDKILIALSGGKDSIELLRLMAERSRIFKPSITVEAAHVIMDNIPYETSRDYLENLCRELGIQLHILHSSFDESTDQRKTKCFLCSWNRRKTLLQFAESNGFNKVALGHHQDDIIITLLMNMIFEGSMQTMPPLLKLEHYPISIIRPLCLVPEHLINSLSELLDFHKQKTPCPYETTTHRTTIAQLFRQMEEINPEARYSLWNAILSKEHK